MSRITLQPLSALAMRFYDLYYFFSRDKDLLERRRRYTERLREQEALERQTIHEVTEESFIYAQIIQHALARMHMVYLPSGEHQSAAGQKQDRAQYVQFQAICPSAKIIWYRILINYHTLWGGYLDALPYGVYTGMIADERTLYELSAACARQVEHEFDITAPQDGFWLKVYRMEGVGGLPLEVSFHEMLEHYPQDMRRGTVVLGIGLYHNVHKRNMDDFSHMLIAGATRSGKSNMLNNLICGQLLFTDPTDLRIVLIDLKHLEFVHYRDCPHLYCDIITDAEKAVETLIALDEEMERRAKIMEQRLAKKLIEWNAHCAPEEKLPRILVIIDEYAALMLTSGKKVKQEVQRFVQHGTNIGAATGVHFWICTQHPVGEVIDNSIKTNMQLVIGGRTQNWQQSMTVLGARGLEELPLDNPKGRMIYQFGSEQHTIQAPYISNDDVAWCVAISRGRGAGLVTMDGIDPVIIPEGMAAWALDHGGSLRKAWVDEELYRYGITDSMYRAFMRKLIQSKEIICRGEIFAVRQQGKGGGWHLVATGRKVDPPLVEPEPEAPDEEPAESSPEPAGPDPLTAEERASQGLDAWRAMVAARKEQEQSE